MFGKYSGKGIWILFKYVFRKLFEKLLGQSILNTFSKYLYLYKIKYLFFEILVSVKYSRADVNDKKNVIYTFSSKVIRNTFLKYLYLYTNIFFFLLSIQIRILNNFQYNYLNNLKTYFFKRLSIRVPHKWSQVAILLGNA